MTVLAASLPALPSALGATVATLPALAGGSGYATPFVGPGTYLIFGIVLAPVYLMVIAWFTGKPRDAKRGLLGVAYLVGLTTALWGGLFVATMVISFLFF